MSNFQIQWNWNMAQQSRAKHNTKTCRCVAEARSFRLCLCRRIKDFHDLNVEWLALPCMCAWMYVCMFTCLCPTHKAILYSCVFIFLKCSPFSWIRVLIHVCIMLPPSGIFQYFQHTTTMTDKKGDRIHDQRKMMVSIHRSAVSI